LKISADYLSAEKDEAQAQEAGFDANKKVIETINPTGNVLSNDIDVSAVGRLVTGAKVGVAGVLTEVATGTNKENGLHLQGTYGELVIGADGTYQYIVNNANANHLAATDAPSETFTYAVKSSNGSTSSATLTVTVKGANDLAVFDLSSSSSYVGAVALDAETVSGTVTVSDVDTNQAAFQVPTDLSRTYGEFTFTQTGGIGSWGYKVDRTKSAFAALASGAKATDALTLTSLDGSENKTVMVTVTGVNDAPKLTEVSGLAVLSENRNMTDPLKGGILGATRLSDLVGGITDVDNADKGVAVTSVSNQGVLWYSVDSGDSWTSATPTNPTISSGKALLLAADNATYMYFQQTESTSFDASSVGTSFTFKAWDKTSGAAGDYVNASSAGGATAFSADQQTVLVNDVFKIENTSNQLSINGGSGFDTLVLNGKDLSLDLTATGAVSLSSVERVDLTGTGKNTIKLNLASVTQADVIGSVHTLFITGDNGDAVNLVKPEGWAVESSLPTQMVNNIAYNVYHLDNTHDLLIQQAITNVTFS
jgi:VCBS repeat-containing protein